MNTKPDTIASLLAACIWADGEYDGDERLTAEKTAVDFGFDANEFHNYMTAAMAEMRKFSPDEATSYAVKCARKVDDADTGDVFRAIMKTLLSEGLLSVDEIYSLTVMADALRIDREIAMLLLCEMVKNHPELEISFESTVDDEDEYDEDYDDE